MYIYGTFRCFTGTRQSVIVVCCLAKVHQEQKQNAQKEQGILDGFNNTIQSF